MNGICSSLNEPRAAKFLRLPYRQNRSRLPIPRLTPEGEQVTAVMKTDLKNAYGSLYRTSALADLVSVDTRIAYLLAAEWRYAYTPLW